MNALLLGVGIMVATGVIAALALGIVGWSQVRGVGYVFVHSRDELTHNIAWIKHALKRSVPVTPVGVLHEPPVLVDRRGPVWPHEYCHSAIRIAGLVGWNAQWNPSPPRIGNQPPGEPLVSSVLLSWVPPISALDDKTFLPVHALQPDNSYYIGIFLVGAYQDIMGDTHNLFGRVPEVHVYADAEEPGNFWIEKVIPGMTVNEMLAQVQYFPNDLNRRMSELVRRKIDAGLLRPGAGMQILDQYTACFNESTYCVPG